DLGYKAVATRPSVPASFSVTGGFSVSASGNGPMATAVFGGSDDLSILRGNHQVALGGQMVSWWSNTYGDQSATLKFSFNGQTTGLGMTDFFMGNVSSFNMSTPTGRNKKSKTIGLYGADTWKVNQKLTLNYGLRWEPYFP